MLDQTATTAGKKKADPVDIYVGSRVRLRRNQRGMSQEKLGDALGLTFQQVQKYEKGANRMGASRLVAVARALSCPVGWFFDGMPAEDGKLSAVDIERDKNTAAFLATTAGQLIADRFPQIPTAAAQQTVVELVVHLARPR